MFAKSVVSREASVLGDRILFIFSSLVLLAVRSLCCGILNTHCFVVLVFWKV